jgi:hypothetical protein
MQNFGERCRSSFSRHPAIHPQNELRSRQILLGKSPMKYNANDRFRFEYVVKQRATIRNYRWMSVLGAAILAVLAIEKAKSETATLGIPDSWLGIVLAFGALLSAKYAVRGWRKDVDYEAFVRLCELELQRIGKENGPHQSVQLPPGSLTPRAKE